MSIWFTALINLNPDHVHPNMLPRKGIASVLYKHGLKIDEKYSEMYLKKVSKDAFELGICNPDGYVDEIHNALKQLVKNAYIRSVQVDSHYYS